MENTIYGLFMEKVLQQPEATAIIENKRTLSFKELSAMVDMIADSFPDNTRAVGIVMRHRAEMIASILAVLKTGAMYIPAEPGFPTGRIHYIDDAKSHCTEKIYLKSSSKAKRLCHAFGYSDVMDYMKL